MEKIVEKVLRDSTRRMRLGGGGVHPLYKDRSALEPLSVPRRSSLIWPSLRKRLYLEKTKHAFFKNGADFIDYAQPWRLGRSCGALGTLLERSWGGLKPSWHAFGQSWDTLRLSWDALEALLDASWDVLKTSWEPYRKNVEGDPIFRAILEPKCKPKSSKCELKDQRIFYNIF